MELDINNLLKQLHSISQASLLDEDARARILKASQALCQRLETPYEWVLRMTWQEPTLDLCLRIADDIQLFKHLGQSTELPKTIGELASSTTAQPALLTRILRHLAAKGVIAELAGSQVLYKGTEISTALARPEGSSGIRHVAQLYTPTFQRAPEYFRSIGYGLPRSNRDSAFQHTIGKPGQTYFEWLHEPEHKAVATDFNLLMSFATQHRTSWMDVFPPDHLLQDFKEPSAPLLVDIGGSIGADVVEFRRRYPHLPGRVVLQDLPAVIDSARENEEVLSQKVDCQAHDFFTLQPVHAARIYYMGSILHDWPDNEARKILRNLIPAMRGGYSRLLLNENVIPATDCHPHLSALDLTMMTLFASQERTEKHWRELLGSEGLRLLAVHSIPSCLKSIVEAELI